MGTVETGRCLAKAADVQRAKVADVLLSRTRLGYRVSVYRLDHIYSRWCGEFRYIIKRGEKMIWAGVVFHEHKESSHGWRV